MIVDCAIYANGRRVPGDHDLTAAREASRKPGHFVWLGLHEPTEEEFAVVRRDFDLHDLAVEDAIKAHQRPKLEIYGDTMFLVLKTVGYDEAAESIDIGEILVFVGEDFVVAVRHGSASPLRAARRELEERPDLLALGAGAVVHTIVDKVVDDYLPVAAELERDIEEIEAQVFSPSGDAPTERIFKLKREVIAFHRAASPLEAPLVRIVEGRIPLIPAATLEYFRDAHDHLLRVMEQVDAFRDLLNSVLEVNLTQVSVRQNEDMRKISAWVAIAAAPTMIAGVYGMNFDYMPELNARYGYFVVMGVMVVFCTGLFAFFKRRGWL